MTSEKIYANEVYEKFAMNYARGIENEFRDKKKICLKVEINFAFDFDFDIPPDIAFVIVYDIEQKKFLILRNEADVIKKYKYKLNFKIGHDIDMDTEIFFNELESEFKNRFEGHEKYTQFWKNIVKKEQKEKERAREFQLKIEEIKERETNAKREKLKALGIEIETIKQIEEIMKEEL